MMIKSKILDKIKKVTQTKSSKIVLGLVIFLLSLAVSFDRDNISIKIREPSYDEKMWTNISIATHAMFNGYVRQGVTDDSWFTGYAYKEGLDIFKVSGNKIRVDYDKIPIKDYQWFDFALWTFGWKAPNFSKLLKGFYIKWNNPEVDPQGYFRLGEAERKENTKLYYSAVPLEYIEYARHVEAFLCSLSLLTVFLIGWRYFGLLVGLGAWLYLALNSQFIAVNTQAGMDSSLCLFSLVSIFLTLLLAEEIQQDKRSIPKIIIYSCSLGLSIGLAMSSKFNAATLYIAIIPVALSLLFYVIKQYPKSEEKSNHKYSKLKRLKKEKMLFVKRWSVIILASPASIFLVSFVTLLYMNPHLRSQPTKKVAIIRSSVDAYFQRRAEIKQTAHLKESLSASLKLVTSEMYFSLDKERTNHFGTFGEHIKSRIKLLDGFFILIGIIVAAHKSFLLFKSHKSTSPYLIILSFYFVILYMNADFIWYPMRRYFMPFHITGSLLISIGFVALVQRLKFFSKITTKHALVKH
ncbi:MAG: hypothetical protein OXH57_01230 [Ekhidna sp.]|nr:hypothetical protein [Ekhidna sp.]